MTPAELVTMLRAYGKATIAEGAREVFCDSADLIELLQRDLADERRLTDGLAKSLRGLYEDESVDNVELLLEEWEAMRGLD